LKYDFNEIINRKNTGSLKWDCMSKLFGNDDLIPLWVADMDFPVAEPIIEGIKNRADHPFYGYTQAKSTVIEAIIERMWDKYNWKIEEKWIVFVPGVIPALNLAIRSIATPGDGIILQEPCYHQFFPAVKNSGSQVIHNQLKLVDGRYEMDFKNLEEIFQDKSGHVPFFKPVKGIIFCNPHNPVGRVWKKDEIVRMGETLLDNGATIISDEIHCELLFNGHEHIPFASISEEFEQNSITCSSPSKTFNLAGLNISSIIIPNKKLRSEYIATQSGIVPNPCIFAFAAIEAAYKYGDDWLKQVLKYLEGNLNLVNRYFKDKIKKITVIEAQGTYLIWLDCRKLFMSTEDLKEFMIKKAKVALDNGSVFGKGGDGFMRMNIAVPRPLLKEALKRIENAVNSL